MSQVTGAARGSFALGTVVTFVLTIRSVKHHAPAGTSGTSPNRHNAAVFGCGTADDDDSGRNRAPTTMIRSPRRADDEDSGGKSAAEEEASGRERITDREDRRGALRAVRPRLRARRRPRQRAVRLDGEGPSDTRLYYTRTTRHTTNRCPGLVQRRGLGGAGIFHAVEEELEEVRVGHSLQTQHEPDSSNGVQQPGPPLDSSLRRRYPMNTSTTLVSAAKS